MRRIYLDNNATTQPLPAVIEAMLPYWRDSFGNPGSAHREGQTARKAMEQARARVAIGLGAQPDGVLFTGTGTESDVMAILGAARHRRATTGAATVISSAVEHPAVLAALRVLEHEGFVCIRVGVDREGRPDAAEIAGLITPETALVSLMLANNETGAILPVVEVAARARACAVPIHCDAVNACGKWPVNLDALGVDLLSISGHKFHGPRGVGALLVRCGTELTPLIVGGGHERGQRSGTENVAGIVAIASALDAALDRLADKIDVMRQRSERLFQALVQRVEGLQLNGPSAAEHRLPNTLNLSFPGRSGAEIAAALDREGVAVSTGAACHDGDRIGSHVMEAMGFDAQRARGAVRISLSAHTTDEDISLAIEAFDRVLA